LFHNILFFENLPPTPKGEKRPFGTNQNPL